MSLRLVPKSVTLNDLERRNGGCVISPNSVAFPAHYLLRKSGCRYTTLSVAEYFL